MKKEIIKKNVVIFGTGKLADEFWIKYHDSIHICFFTSNDGNDGVFHSLPRVEPNELRNIDNIYIVICAQDVSVCNIECQLSMEFKFLDEYISCSLFEELVIGQKELLLLIGICQQKEVEYGLKCIDSIREKYAIQFYWYAMVRDNIALRNHVGLLSQHAKYTIVLNADNNQKYPYVSEKTKLIKMPYLKMEAIFPQIPWGAYMEKPKILHMGDTYLENPKMLEEAKRPISDIRAFRFTDQNVIKMLEEGMSEEEILREISREDFYSKEYLLKLLKKGEEDNRMIDEQSDIRNAAYIIENYDREKLFLDGIHYSDLFLWRVIKEIVAQINENVDWTHVEQKGIVSELSKENAVWENECPIYPSVWKNLGLKWVDENTRYTTVKLQETPKMTFVEYMRVYIKYVKHVLEIQKLW